MFFFNLQTCNGADMKIAVGVKTKGDKMAWRLPIGVGITGDTMLTRYFAHDIDGIKINTRYIVR